MPVYDIILTFHVKGPRPNDEVAGFLKAAPHLWKQLYNRKVMFDVVSIRQPSETDLVVRVDAPNLKQLEEWLIDMKHTKDVIYKAWDMYTACKDIHNTGKEPVGLLMWKIDDIQSKM